MILNIIAYAIVAASVGFAIYRIFFKKKPTCSACSKSGSGCKGCPLYKG
ncbi:MAG: FeoB-associated Cys-rich membrane protein [Bacteroidales bacterium]|nr:FeoB-associated Cys-rich membrane protein [Bacteroidales bacterium]